MLRIRRRPIDKFLDASHQTALSERVAAARKLAKDSALTREMKSKRIGYRWDDFRQGKVSRGTFDNLWSELQSMSFNKCTFCETPHPMTVEHLDPKSISPEKTFDWDNLLAACDTCNRVRENSGITSKPFDPSNAEPLDHFGWDEYGGFAAKPAHSAFVTDLVKIYGLHRFRAQRCRSVLNMRAWLINLIDEDATKSETVVALKRNLSESTEWLGPVREYLLRPPTVHDALIVQGALSLLPEIRAWVEPWLRPPPWAPKWWS